MSIAEAWTLIATVGVIALIGVLIADLRYIRRLRRERDALRLDWDVLPSRVMQLNTARPIEDRTLVFVRLRDVLELLKESKS